jgi:gliding motility-associated-like protein
LGPINGYTGATTSSVLANDTLNGVTVIPSQVILTGLTVPTGLTLNTDGTITIAPQTPAGTYNVIYKICETLNPTNCDTVTSTVSVTAAVIDAIGDAFGPINGYTGATTSSVLANDTLNGVTVIPSQVILTGLTVPTGLTLNADGTITIAPQTPAGTYNVIYRICETLNPTNCDTVTSTVIVGGCLDFAINDCDNDGETNGTENSNGTDPNNPCSYTNAPATSSAAYATWSVLDCDGDGTPNGLDTNPQDPCVSAAGSIPVVSNPIWANADCDYDGETNGTEKTNGTDPNNPCSYTNAPATSSAAYASWSVLDCDGDGTPNGLDTNPQNPCVSAAGSIPVVTNPIWANADCDNDGESNGTEITNGTDPNNPCSYTNAPATSSAAYATWSVLDCDGDGAPNGLDTNPQDPCVSAAGSIPVVSNPIWANADCDNDGESNGTENTNGTDPNNPCSYTNAPATSSAAYASWSVLDCDGDGVINGTELADGTDVNNPCESINDHATALPSTSFLAGDCDGDGLSNEEEIGANPNVPNDSNGNGIPDYLEINNHNISDDDLEIFNAVTPNGNSDNDIFVIRNIQNFPQNTVTIFNRWGVIVYEVDGYGQNTNFFKGISEGRTTINKNEALPIGTYFYTLRYINKNGVTKERSGYLYLNK